MKQRSVSSVLILAFLVLFILLPASQVRSVRIVVRQIQVERRPTLPGKTGSCYWLNLFSQLHFLRRLVSVPQLFSSGPRRLLYKNSLQRRFEYLVFNGARSYVLKAPRAQGRQHRWSRGRQLWSGQSCRDSGVHLCTVYVDAVALQSQFLYAGNMLMLHICYRSPEQWKLFDTTWLPAEHPLTVY